MKIKFFLNMLVIFFLFILPAFSLGIGSKQTSVTLKKGESRVLQFYIINDEQKDMNVTLSISGVLKDYLVPEDTRFTLKATEKILPFKIYAVIPEDFYATGKTKISVSEENQGSGQITAMVVASFVVNYNEQKEDQSYGASSGAGGGGSAKEKKQPTLIIPEMNQEKEGKVEDKFKEVNKTIDQEKNKSTFFIEKPKEEKRISKSQIISLIIISISILTLIGFIFYLKQTRSYSGDSIVKVENFVKKSLNKGISENEIRKKLKSVGWPDRIIEDILKRNKNN